jgi:hypothetical protein
VSSKSPFGLRLPTEVRNRLTVRAKGNERSMNSEIITTFKELMRAEGRRPRGGSEGRYEMGVEP